MSSQEQLSLTALSVGEPRPDSVREDVDTKGPRIRVERSALWAAYGDALGWISELTDKSGLLRRTSGDPLVRPIAWEAADRRADGCHCFITAGLLFRRLAVASFYEPCDRSQPIRR